MVKRHTQVAVLGGGGFGTVLAELMARNGHTVRLWVRSEAQAQEINQQRCNRRYYPKRRLSTRITATHDAAAALLGATVVFLAVPSTAYRAVIASVKKYLEAKCYVISTIKGFDQTDFEQKECRLISEGLTGLLPDAHIGVLGGPNLASEILLRRPTGTVIASRHAPLRDAVTQLMHNDYFRVYSSEDVRGVELAGALKNIYAIVAGMAATLRVGNNAQSMLITRSLVEMSRFAFHLGADPMSFLGLAGVGDLVATCSSQLSRNYRLGRAVGRGKSLPQALQELQQVAEGVNTLRQVKEQAEARQIPMPIATSLYDVLFHGVSIPAAVHKLMLVDSGEDIEFLLRFRPVPAAPPVPGAPFALPTPTDKPPHGA